MRLLNTIYYWKWQMFVLITVYLCMNGCLYEYVFIYVHICVYVWVYMCICKYVWIVYKYALSLHMLQSTRKCRWIHFFKSSVSDKKTRASFNESPEKENYSEWKATRINKERCLLIVSIIFIAATLALAVTLAIKLTESTEPNPTEERTHSGELLFISLKPFCHIALNPD